MHSTNEILDAIAIKYDHATDYRLSKLLGTSTGGLANWRKGRTALSQTYAVKAAELLGWEPAYVMACVEFERAEKDSRLEQTDEIKATWVKIAQRFKPAAAIVAVMLLGVLAAPSTGYAAGCEVVSTCNLYIMRSVRRWLRRASQFLRVAVRSYGLAAVNPT